jgi:D-sedoheptulose 7-phosphate isomerase
MRGKMNYLHHLTDRYPLLSPIEDAISSAFTLIAASFERGGKLLVAGNGGSAADAEHIVGELMKGFAKKRPVTADFGEKLREIAAEHREYLTKTIQCGLPAIALSSHAALLTACINDMDGNCVYAQQVYGYGTEKDVLLGISTSGNSKNILYAMITAKTKGMKTILLTGKNAGTIAPYADVSINVPETETYKIQELHLPIYHTLCLMLEEHFF